MAAAAVTATAVTDVGGATRTARCACGQLSAEVEGEPVRISVCHCHACQRRTGSAFGAQARFPKERVRVAGESTEFVRVGESGGVIRFRFCPQCGSTVYYAMDGAPDTVAVALGAFADATFPPPTFSVYEARKHAWVELHGELERWD